MTPAENLPYILKSGLIGKNRVFMTDCLLWVKRFVYEKKSVSKLNQCCVLEINTSLLRKLGNPICVTNRAREFTTDYVPAECIRLYDTFD